MIDLELHSHTHHSIDSLNRLNDIIRTCRDVGIDRIAVTDHNTCDAVAHLAKVGLMREDGLPVDGFLIIPGVEVSTADGHLLCLGVTLPNMKGVPALEVAAAVKKSE